MEFTNNKPIYKQIADYAFSCILSGEWKPQERVPSVRELAVQLAVNNNTVLKAMDFLQAREVIYPKRGMGFFLAADAPERVMAARREEFFSTTLEAVRSEMEMLGITPEEVAEALRR
ncbi:MAG: GntR family transcriptional regulator [Bacteroidales bacterium]|nr:GntR family transcriptional regulator [Bacteroidales bacterium]